MGILLPQIGESATRENIVRISNESEKEGFDSLWTIDRLLWPVKELIQQHLMAYLAGITDRISLGTAVIDMLFQSPIILAKRLTTLVILSDGRLIAGLGWSKDEYDVSGIPFRNRGARADEFLQLSKKIWTIEVVVFRGKYYNIPAAKINPKPVQKPRPPILLGGFTPKTF